MKRYIAKIAAFTIAAAIGAAGFAVAAAENEKVDSEPVAEAVAEPEPEVSKAQWIQNEATVVSAEGSLADGYTITATIGEETIIYHATEEGTVIFSQKFMNYADSPVFKEGDKILAAYPANTIVALSFPAQITPAVIVLLDGKDDLPMIKVDVFESGLSSDGALRLGRTLPHENIRDTSGEQADLSHFEGATLLVFYAKTTKSIPPQASPEMVYILKGGPDDKARVSDEDFVAAYIEENLKDAATEIEGISYVPLRALFEGLGYKAEWEDGFAVLTKDDSVYKFSPNRKAYTVGEETKYLDIAPFNDNGKIYVEAAFIAAIVR